MGAKKGREETMVKNDGGLGRVCVVDNLESSQKNVQRELREY